jgi:hypothetical protein
MTESESGMTDEVAGPTEEPEAVTPAPAKPGEAGILKTGDMAADAEALAAYPYVELRQYAVDIGVEPAKSKAETLERILAWMYPPIRKGVTGVVEPGQASVRVRRIRDASGE